MKRLILLTLLFAICRIASAQCSHEHSSCGTSHVCCGLQPIFEDAFSFIPPHPGFFSGERTSTFIVNYTGFTPEAQNAFQYAVDIWASLLDSSVPIVINASYQSIAGNSLGFASANQLFDNFPNAPQPNTAYPVALASKLAGFDINPNSHDISATFNSNFTWYFGTDGNCPAGTFDFVTVVLHELGHGLGIAGSPTVSAGLGNWQLPVRVVYDKLIENGSQQNITSFPANSAELAAQLTGNDLFWFGSNAVEANNLVNPKIHAPLTFSLGSSFSHLNEATFLVGDVNSLMTPFVQQAEANHYPGPVVMGMLKDMGWSLKSESACSGLEWVMALQTDCNPEETYWQLLNSEGNPLMTVGADTYQEAATQLISLCLQPGECYTLLLQDGGGNGLSALVSGCTEDGGLAIFDTLGNLIVELENVEFGASVTFEFCAGEEGCTNQEAINFDPDAVFDDGSCFFECGLPSVTWEIVCEGENPTEFYVDVNVGNLGPAGPYLFAVPQSGLAAELSSSTVVEIGPYPVGTDVDVILSSVPFPVCSASVIIPGICPVGLSEIENKLWLIYPNPIENEFFIDVPENGNLILFNVTGQKVMEAVLDQGINRMNVPGPISGVFFAQIRSGQRVQIFRLLKGLN